MARKEGAGGESGAPAWMATFADLMSLLLTFFILLLSFAEMDIVKFKDALGSVQETLGTVKGGGVGLLNSAGSPISLPNPPQHAMPLPMPAPAPKAADSAQAVNESISKNLEKSVRMMGLEDNVEIESTKRGVVMKVRGHMFFNEGTADLKYESQPIFQKIAELMREYPRKIAIEGHTDNVPISSGKYSNNWELSTARAYSALKFLEEYEGIEVSRIHIAGFGDTRPLVSNETPEGRAKNRRVEFVFYEE